MKKLICILVLLLSLVCILAGCDKDPQSQDPTPDAQTAHTHDDGEWVTVTNSTCTEQGKQARLCTSCKATLEEKSIPAAHTPGTPATCKAAQVCLACNATLQEPLAHTHTAVVTAPTCTTQGFTTHTCVCGDSYVDSYVNETGHNHTPTVTPPTCTAQGFTTHTCTCGDSFINTYVNASHSYGTDHICSNCLKTAPGLYDANNTQLASWETLTTTYGMNVTVTYTFRDYYTKTTSPYYILTNTVALADGVRLVVGDVSKISEGAFYACAMLTSIELPDTVTQIGEHAFFSCTGLTAIKIPASVTSISFNPFLGCTKIESITVAAGNTAYRSEGNCLIEIASKTLLTGCKNSVIPTDGSVTSIGVSAFYDCIGLVSITIPKSVTSIGSSAFGGCMALTTINYTCIPDEWNAITFGSSWNSPIGEYTVAYPNISSQVTAPTCNQKGYTTHTCTCGCEAVYTDSYLTARHSYGENNAPCTSCGQSAPGLYNAQGNMIVSWDELINDYGMNVTNRYTDSSNGAEMPRFVLQEGYNVYGVKLVIGNVDYISAYAFKECNRLKVIEIPENVRTIDSFAFIGCLELTTVKISSATTVSIGQEAFENCMNLSEILFPTNLTRIGPMAFNNCIKLSQVSLPEGLLTLGYSCFAGCTTLTGIRIPQSVTTIEREVFLNCNNFESVVFEDNSQLTILGERAFANTKVIQEDGDFSYVGKWLIEYSGNATNLTLPADIIGIAGGAFKNNTTLESITIGEAAAGIGPYAFYGCSNLTSVTIGSNVTKIGEEAFSGCSLLTSVKFAENSKLTSIGYKAFANCTSLESITLPANLMLIETYAFHNCTNLATVQFVETTGWEKHFSLESTSGIPFELGTPQNAATLLKTTYRSYVWMRTGA